MFSENLNKTVRCLGIILDEKLTREAHIDSLCTKIGSVIYVIDNPRGTVFIEVPKLVYFGLIQSKMQYKNITQKRFSKTVNKMKDKYYNLTTTNFNFMHSMTTNVLHCNLFQISLCEFKLS